MSRIQASHSRAALARKARNEQPVRIVSSQMLGEEIEASISRMSSDRSAANDCFTEKTHWLRLSHRQ
jgi:hypothetical protein